MEDRPASLDFNQACYTNFAAVLPSCSCKNTKGALSLLQAFILLPFTVAATIVHLISNN